MTADDRIADIPPLRVMESHLYGDCTDRENCWMRDVHNTFEARDERDAALARVAEVEAECERLQGIAACAVDAAKLTNEQHLKGNVDPVGVIAAISSECLANRSLVAELGAERDVLQRQVDADRKALSEIEQTADYWRSQIGTTGFDRISEKARAALAAGTPTDTEEERL